MLRRVEKAVQYNQWKNDYTIKKRANNSVNTLEIHDTWVYRDYETFVAST